MRNLSNVITNWQKVSAMATVFYKRCITEYIDQLPGEEPITTDEITAFIAQKTGESFDKVKKDVNVNMARLEKEGFVSRVARGLYCKRIKTAFGDYTPSKDVIYSKRLVSDGEDVVGYETGLSLMNDIGLVSQMPGKKSIASNKYRMKVPTDVAIDIHKPATTVTKENYKYLQLLDIIAELDNAPVDAHNPEIIIREIASSAGLKLEKLLLLARNYYNEHTLGRTVDIMLGGITLSS